jgi:hypothetical protein
MGTAGSDTFKQGVLHMSRWFLGAVLLTVYAAPVSAQDKKKPDPAKAMDADTLPAGQYTGKLKTPPGTDGSFVVAVEYQHYVLKNPNQLPKNANPQMQRLLRDQQKIAQLQKKIAGARTAKQQAQAIQQLQQATNQFQLDLAAAQLNPGQSPFNVVTDTKDVTFHAAENMKVRFANPPTVFDEKGNIKKYTPEELKDLKGKGDDAKLPGYEGSVDKLTANSIVRVTTLANKPKKDDKKPDADKKPDEANKDVDKKPDADKKDPGPKTLASLILVLEDAGMASDSTDPKKKKKNN